MIELLYGFVAIIVVGMIWLAYEIRVAPEMEDE